MAKTTRFQGQHVLITGAASGIGEACAAEFARRGARLSIVDIDAEGARAAAERVRERGGEARAYAVDVADERAVLELADRAVREGGPVDILVNNAGVAVVAPFLATSEVDWEWLLGINLRGPLRLTRALLPAMIARDRGHVVFVASLAGLVGAPGMVAYSTSKFALVGFAEALRLELSASRVAVTSVCPGYVRTNLHRATRYDNERFRRFLDEAPGFFGLSSSEAASRIVGAVEERRALLTLGPEKLGWWLKRISPEAAFTVARWVSRLTRLAPLSSPAQPEDPCTSR